MKEYTFDTNTFNRLLDDVNAPEIPDNIKIYGSHIQMEELSATKNILRQISLLEIFSEVTNQVVKTESMVFPIRFDQMKFGNGTYDEIRSALDVEAHKIGNKKKKNKIKNNPNDALIGEIAVINKYILVTDDLELLKVINAYDIQVLNYNEFKLAITRCPF